LSIKIQLTPEAQATLRAVQRLPQTALVEIAKAMNLQNDFTVRHIMLDYLSFPKDQPPVEMGLRAITGQLRGRLRASKAEVSGQTVSSGIGSSVKYAAIQELGGRTAPHDIYPKNKATLKFQLGDRTVFAKVVHHPGSEIPARAPIQHGIQDRLDNYSKAISDAIINALNQ
jgi:phage gpG-like protein